MASSPLTIERAPTTAACVIATAILAGLAGFFIGQGASVGIFGSAPVAARTQKQKKDVKGKGRAVDDDKADDDEEDEDEDEEWESEGEEEDSEDEEGGELASFEGNSEEVKLVLVVRTDMGMGKGEFYCIASLQAEIFDRATYLPRTRADYVFFFRYSRQNRSAMLARHARLLQILPLQIAVLTHPQALGARRPGQGRAAGEIRGRDATAAGAGAESGTVRARDPGRWAHADCEWEPHCVGRFGAEECG